MRRIRNNTRRGILSGLGYIDVPSTQYAFTEPSLETATRIVEQWRSTVGTQAGNQIEVGYLDGDRATKVVRVGGKLYAIRLAPTNQGITPPANMAAVVMGELVAFVREMTPKEAATTGPDGCPCRTETTVVQRTVVIPVRQTRVICDTPPPTSTVPPCDEVTAAVRQQLNAQGVQGLRGLASCGCRTAALSGTVLAPTTTIRPSRDSITTMPASATVQPTITADSGDTNSVLPWIGAGVAALLLFAIIK